MDHKDPPPPSQIESWPLRQNTQQDAENNLMHKDSDIQRDNSLLNSSLHSNSNVQGYKYFGDITKQDVLVFALYILIFAAIIVGDIFY